MSPRAADYLSAVRGAAASELGQAAGGLLGFELADESNAEPAPALEGIRPGTRPGQGRKAAARRPASSWAPWLLGLGAAALVGVAVSRRRG